MQSNDQNLVSTGTVSWSRSRSKPDEDQLLVLKSRDYLPFLPTRPENIRLPSGMYLPSARVEYSFTGNNAVQVTDRADIISLKSVSNFYLDQNDIGNLAALVRKVSEQKVPVANEKAFENLLIPESHREIGLTATEVGLFVVLTFGSLLVATLVLKIQFIHPAIGFICTFMGLTYTAMGWRDKSMHKP